VVSIRARQALALLNHHSRSVFTTNEFSIFILAPCLPSLTWGEGNIRQLLFIRHGLSSLNNFYFLIRQPIQPIHPLINLLIDLRDLTFQIPLSVQINLPPHELALLLQANIISTSLKLH
jgi:hypothetical protein